MTNTIILLDHKGDDLPIEVDDDGDLRVGNYFEGATYISKKSIPELVKFLNKNQKKFKQQKNRWQETILEEHRGRI